MTICIPFVHTLNSVYMANLNKKSNPFSGILSLLLFLPWSNELNVCYPPPKKKEKRSDVREPKASVILMVVVAVRCRSVPMDHRAMGLSGFEAILFHYTRAPKYYY